MIEKCQLAATEVANLNVLNASTARKAVGALDSLRVHRLIITDASGMCLYDSESPNSDASAYMLLPEIVRALDGNDVFSWNYESGTMQSRSAIPVISYGTLIGCVYMMEFDPAQGALIQNLQRTTLVITLILEFAVIIFSLFFSRAFTARLRKIMTSMRIIREGEYSHKVKMGGNDELTVLGDEFNDLVERLQTSEQKRQNFVSDASHELKTPLASIKLLSDSILHNEMDIQTIKEFVQDIGNEAERLNKMSQKLLSLSRIEGQQDSDCEIVYIAPTVERVIRMLSMIAEECDVSIHTDLKDDCTILIIEDDLYQILFNLIENGIKYNRPGGHLYITLTKSEDNALVQIRDTGVGISEDALTHIFERFYRVDKARSRKSGGAGLGLSIVRNMVERNQGTISVESKVDIGTSFTVSFPVFDTEDEE